MTKERGHKTHDRPPGMPGSRVLPPRNIGSLGPAKKCEENLDNSLIYCFSISHDMDINAYRLAWFQALHHQNQPYNKYKTFQQSINVDKVPHLEKLQ